MALEERQSTPRATGAHLSPVDASNRWDMKHNVELSRVACPANDTSPPKLYEALVHKKRMLLDVSEVQGQQSLPDPSDFTVTVGTTPREVTRVHI